MQYYIYRQTSFRSDGYNGDNN